MKKVVLITMLTMLTLLSFAKTVQVTSFEGLMEDLKKGENIRVVINYGDCKLISNNEEKTAPNATGGMSIGVWEYFAPMSIGNPNAFLVFSESKLINYGGYIYNYAKVKIKDDGTVTVTAQYANSEDFEIEMDEKFFTTVNSGDEEGALFLYKQK